MDAKSNRKTLFAVLAVLGTYAVAKAPLTTALRVMYKDSLPGEPKPGAIIYRDLLTGYAEHSGIYVGGGEKCIVELQRDAETHHSVIRLVTPGEFVQNGYGCTETIFVSARDGVPVGNPEVASIARSQLDQDYDAYSLFKNNCHMFAFSCLKAAEAHEEFSVAKMQDTSMRHWPKRKMTLTSLKSTAERVLGADSWLKWEWQEKTALEGARKQLSPEI
ncbi:hypothetical protein [Succinimonas amylolytica]|uniref:hypothetical protein n=1 Tax=Succinimonas amylolytica TaxID=83769 RepID=UPI0012FA5D1D|nr:hypothetical protein [Succinimonas amylolytica]